MEQVHFDRPAMYSFKFWLAVAALTAAGLLGFVSREEFDPMSIRGKRVIVTGASTGIGEQLAYWYSRLGARVLITARREAVLQQVVAKCKELGAEDAFYIPLDMGNYNDTEPLIREAERRFGGLDHLLLNHIYSNYPQLWEGGKLDLLQKYMDINFRSYVALATHATPVLAKSNGSIGVVSSIAGQVALPFFPSYSASKFALHGFFGSLRHDFDIHGLNISITEHIIGAINTTNALKFTEGALNPSTLDSTPEETAYRIMEGTAMRERRVYFPLSARLMMLRDFMPASLDKMFRQSFSEDTAAIARNVVYP
ncbi:hydroxysteroid 11-beta-dehydrogenase 1-like protein [Diadema antillarum]|uniref:hydroxysteroid 11-beta-dehydrogenase 1-like protein n=1 Tax=Diadema antillarum TaxID=105358 RepID=UPI003A857AC5